MQRKHQVEALRAHFGEPTNLRVCCAHRGFTLAELKTMAENCKRVPAKPAETFWQAVQTGAIDFFADADPVRWAEGYDFPAIREGRLVRTEIEHEIAHGTLEIPETNPTTTTDIEAAVTDSLPPPHNE